LGHDDIRFQIDEFARGMTNIVGVDAGPAIVDLDVVPLRPAVFAKGLDECRDVFPRLSVALGQSQQ
jgi:hypothetical protein